MYIFKKQIVGSNLFAKTNLWFTIGFILTAALTFSEVARGRQYNFMIFSDATRDFWNGILFLYLHYRINIPRRQNARYSCIHCLS